MIPIFNEKLLKNRICGSVNSTNCEKVNKYGLKKRENTEETKCGRDKLDPNTYLGSV